MYVNNAVFDVQAANHEHYALRVHRPGHKHPDWIRSELTWLEAITQDTTLCVPRPVRRPDGELLTNVPVDGLNEPVTCVLFGWIDGQFYRTDTVSNSQVQVVGTFLARLHEYSSEFNPPPDFVRPRLDAEGMFGAESAYNPGEGATLFTDRHRAIFAAVEDRVRRVMAELGMSKDSFGMIHADLIMKNLVFQKNQVCAIDFDDCSWGYYLYDLAPLLLQFKDEPRYPELREVLWEGYTSQRRLPDSYRAHVETFIAARHMASCWWLAGNLHNPRIRERAAELIAYRTTELERFLESGSISQQGDTF